MSEFVYSPQGAVTASQTSSLSHDFLVADTVPVYTQSRSPIAAFVNPNTPNNFPEALAITVDPNTQGPVLTHLTRSAGNQGELAWVSNSFGVAAQEVAAGTALLAFSPQVYGFYHDGTSLYSMQLNGTTWSGTTQLGAAITGLKIAYSQNGILVLYGQAVSGNLVLCWQEGNGPFNYTEMTNAPVSSDVQVTLQDGDTGPTWYAGSISNGALTIAQGSFPATPSPTGEAASVGTAAASGGGQVVAGFWNFQNVAPAFLYVDGNGALNSYSGYSAKVQDSVAIASATGFQMNPNSPYSLLDPNNPGGLYANLDPKGQGQSSLHVYSVDTSGGLWVLHQDPTTPWNADGTPNFTQNLSLTSGITHVIGDLNPAGAPTLFAIGDYQGIPCVRLHYQDVNSRHWHTDHMHVPPAQAQTIDVTRYRTEITVIDGNGVAVPNCSMSLALTPPPSSVSPPPAPPSSLDVAAGGQTYYLTPSAPIQNLVTNAQGKLTFSVLADSALAIPQITVTDNAGYGINLIVSPSAPLHQYFAGTGTLDNNNPPFDAAGTTLSGATVSASPNSPPRSIITNNGNCAGVAQGVSQLGAAAPTILGNTSTTMSFRAVSLDMRDPANPRSYTFTDKAALDAHLQAMPMAALSFGSWLEHFGEDVIHGIEHAVTAVAHAVITVADDVASLAITIGDATINFIVKTAEEIGHAISSAFMWVVDKIEDLIDWLKAIFNLGAIMNTQAAFVRMVKQVIGDPTATTLPEQQGYIVSTLASQASKADGWFQSQCDQINGLFAGLITKYQSNGIQSLPGYQAPGAPSNSTVDPNNKVSPSDCTSNVHHNFMQEKVSSGGPATSPASSDSSLATTWGTFESSLGQALTDFEKAIPQLIKGLQTIIDNPSSAASAGIGDLLTAAQDIIDAFLELADAAVQGLCAMAAEVMTALANMLNTQIGDGFLTTIWSWMGGTGPLTLLDLLALVVAFPATIIYTISQGSEPFPSQDSFAAMRSFAAADNTFLMFLAGELQLFAFIPAVAILATGASTPWPLTLVKVVMSCLVFVLSGGLKDFSTLEWIGVAAVATLILWLAPVANLILEGMGAAQRQGALTSLGDTAKLVGSVIGLAILTFAIIDAEDNSPPISITAAHVMNSMPQIFGFLQTQWFTDNTTASVISGIAVTVGYIGSGCAYMASSASS